MKTFLSFTLRPQRSRLNRFLCGAFVLGVALCLLAPLHAQSQSPHLTMGNPSHATPNPAEKDNFLMGKQFFALSYNNTKGTPNWVSWQLTEDDLGNAPRFAFYPDEDLKASGLKEVLPKDYTKQGFDRGHMCPHSDRGASHDMSEETFVMSNIIPQSPPVNEKAWAQLENYCRHLVENQNRTLYVVCGPAGKGGEGKNGSKDSFGPQNKVVVPAQCWKVIMVLDGPPGNDVEKVNNQTRLIAVIMPNDMSVGEDWARFRCSVKEVEQLTGFKFFDQVPESVIGPLKEKTDHVKIPVALAIHHGSGE